MAVQLLHVSDIHFGSGESHGQINPTTGLNVRFEDFVDALRRTVDFALEKRVDVFLFSGDAYRNASPEPIYQKQFATQLKRLSLAGICTILVVGNHDQILRSTASHSLSVFQSLEIPGVIVVDRPLCQRIDTANGALQLIGLPHVTRHQMMTLEKYAAVPASVIDRILTEHVTNLLKGYYDELDPSLPTVVTAHMSLDNALAGIEQDLLLGYTLTFPMEMFVDERIDYVALGHIHKHQVLREREPAVVYAGSLERVDFGEEKEDKGFVHVSLERKNVQYTFHSIGPRPFITVDVDVTGSADPTADICRQIGKAIRPGCVLRLRCQVKQEQLSEIEEDKVRNSAAQALSFRMLPEVMIAQNRGRLPQLTEHSAAAPLTALSIYLDEVAPDRKDELLNKAKSIMDELNSELKAGNS